MDLNKLNNDIFELISQKQIMGKEPREIGSCIEREIKLIIEETTQGNNCVQTLRSMEDFSIVLNNNTYFFDVKTKDMNKKFSMPNITSIDRLRTLYEEDTNFFVLLFVDYENTNDKIKILKTTTILIEHLSFECLNIGNLGLGQLQLKRNIILYQKNRKEWLFELKNNTILFYHDLIKKTAERLKKVIETW